jgi:lipoprotein-anchoring transpeptidase ErfK/SrfK
VQTNGTVAERGRQALGVRPPGWRRAGLIAAALAVPLTPIVAGIVITAPTRAKSTLNASYSAIARRTSAAIVARPAFGGPAAAAQLVQAAPFAPRSHPTGALVAAVLHPTPMRASPSGGRVLGDQGTRTGFGSRAVLLVVRRRAGWLGVVSPLAGNNQLGWIPRSAASLSRVRWELVVTLAKRQVAVLDDGKVLRRYTIAIGAPYAPTPTGRFAVTDRLQTHDPSGPYGCCILALSAVAPHAIPGWTGGNRIAIHSTPDTASIGQPVSHGCMRLTLPEGRWLVDHIPLGTPTVIRT